VEVVAMRAVVVYESIYGNTHEVASAVQEGMRSADPAVEVELVDVGHAEPDVVGSADLLVVGAPTHMHGLSTAWSRRMGAKSEPKKGPPAQVEPGATGPGVRDWLPTLPAPRPGARAAAFDTRGDAPLVGGAARPIARKLRHAGYRLAGRPTGFLIEDAQGPLKSGELDRARTWGADLLR
jgi:hypothetical protein